MMSLMLFCCLQNELCGNVLLSQFQRLYNIFVKVLIDTNVNISYDLNFSDICQSENYIGSVAKFT